MVLRQLECLVTVVLERVDLVECRARAVGIDDREAFVIDALHDQVGQLFRLARERARNKGCA